MFRCFIPDINQAFNSYFYTAWEKLDFLNKFISETFCCLLGLLKLEIKQLFSSTKTKFVRGLVSLDC